MSVRVPPGNPSATADAGRSADDDYEYEESELDAAAHGPDLEKVRACVAALLQQAAEGAATPPGPAQPVRNVEYDTFRKEELTDFGAPTPPTTPAHHFPARHSPLPTSSSAVNTAWQHSAPTVELMEPHGTPVWSSYPVWAPAQGLRPDPQPFERSAAMDAGSYVVVRGPSRIFNNPPATSRQHLELQDAAARRAAMRSGFLDRLKAAGLTSPVCEDFSEEGLQRARVWQDRLMQEIQEMQEHSQQRRGVETTGGEQTLGMAVLGPNGSPRAESPDTVVHVDRQPAPHQQPCAQPRQLQSGDDTGSNVTPQPQQPRTPRQQQPKETWCTSAPRTTPQSRRFSSASQRAADAQLIQLQDAGVHPAVQPYQGPTDAEQRAQAQLHGESIMPRRGFGPVPTAPRAMRNAVPHRSMDVSDAARAAVAGDLRRVYAHGQQNQRWGGRPVEENRLRR
ncbi:hypothetical protein EDC01DRAFT_728602 [Geopyxis carbonaria]|nr:hypothetical protein EDC01DRAFT_728602 [Geopyxis carbonaria]